MEVGATISIKGLKGIIRYVGEYHEKPGIFVGIELEKPKGKNNGTIKGKKYFECPENHGLFVELSAAQSIMKVVTESSETSDSTPLQSPRINLKSTTKPQPISKSIDSLKPTPGKPQTAPVAKNNGNQQQSLSKGQANSNLAEKPIKPPDTQHEAHSAREPTVTFKQRTKNTNPPTTNSLLTPESPISAPVTKTAAPTLTTPTSAQKTTAQTTSTTAKPEAQAPTASPSSNTPIRRAAISPSQSNPGLSLNNKPNTSKVQSARPPANATSNQTQASSSSMKSDAKSESSENISTKPSTTPSKSTPTPEKTATSGAKSTTTTANLNTKADSTGKVQSARTASESERNQVQMPSSAREPPTKPIISNPQDSPIIPQTPQNAQTHQEPQKQQSSSKTNSPHPAIPPLSIPQIQNEEPELNKTSAASVSFEEIKKKIPISSNSAMPSATRDIPNRSNSILLSTEHQVTTTSAEQSDTENSPRMAKQPQTAITPEIQAKIKDLNAKHEGYIKQKALIRQKLLDIANSYKKKKAEQEKYLLKFAQESQNKLIQLEIDIETDINDLENQILESAERTHRYLEIADEQRANKVMDLLRQINEEHVNFENDLDLFINAQRINVNTATQSVHILTERLKKVLMKRQVNEKLIAKKKSIITDRENELAEKRPRWQEVTGLRTTFSELSEKVNHYKKASVYKNAEKEGMRRFYQMFADVPLLDSLYLVLCIEKKTQNNDILHICELTKFVLSGFITNTSKCYDLFNALSEVNESIEKDEIPHSLISVSLALDTISSVPLDNVITIFQLKSSAEKIKDEKLKNQLNDIISEIKNSNIFHFALLEPDKKENFIEFAKNFVFELKKAEADEEDEECDLSQFKGQLEKFNVPEIDIIKGFIDFQMPQQTPQEKQKVLPEIAKKKQEKKDIEAKSIFLQEEISKEKAKFEALRSELDEPMKLYIELADRLDAAKKKLDKYQIQNE